MNDTANIESSSLPTIAVLLPEDGLAWHRDALQRLSRANAGRLSVHKLRVERRSGIGVANELLDRLERIVVGGTAVVESALDPVDIPNVEGADSGLLLTAEGHFVVTAMPESLSGADIVINLTGKRLSPAACDTLGVTILEGRVGLTDTSKDRPAGWYEVLAGRGELFSWVARSSPGVPDDIVAYSSQSVSETSVPDTASAGFWKLSCLIERGLLATLEKQKVQVDLVRLPDEIRAGGEVRVGPSFRVFRLLGRALRKFYLKLRELRSERQWILLAGKQSGNGPPSGLTVVDVPGDRFWADPFPYTHDGKTCVFFEELQFATGRGEIFVADVDADGLPGNARRVLAEDYHLSYPNVFEHDGIIYMIPESYDNRTVDLYRCVEFPGRWVFEKTLIHDCAFADATLIEWQGRWWMFGTVSETSNISPWDELCIYYSDSPVADTWLPHAANPVISDVRYARPAGRMFMQDGEIIRPAQDSSFHYGRRMTLNRVLQLDEFSYREETLTHIEADQHGLFAAHTYNAHGGLMFMDAQRWVRKR